MFSRMEIAKSTRTYSDEVERLKEALAAADAVVIGAGAGLSSSAGFIYSGERFHQHFADFEDKYGFHDMYSGAFCRYDTPEEHWAYWSRFIMVNRYMDAPKPVYKEIFLRTRKNLCVLFWELGVGYNTPGIIKYPFWQLTAQNPKATYACINYGEAGYPREIAHQSICIDGDIGKVFSCF